MTNDKELPLSQNGPLGWPPQLEGQTKQSRWGTDSEFQNLKKINAKFGEPSKICDSPSTNWSGFVAFRKNKDVTITQVEACWTVPGVERSPDDNRWYTCSCWIGIGGAGIPGDDESKCILQVGTDSDIMRLGNSSSWYGAWYQWVPGPTWILDKQLFPVVPGDTIDAVIVMHKGSKTEATIYLHNRTRGIATSFDVTSPRKVEVTGNCAEWIVEKVEFADDPPALAYYGAVYFDEARAYTDLGEEVGLKEGDRGTLYHIINNDGEHCSQATLLGDHMVRCVHVGPGSAGRQAIRNEFFSPNDAADLKKVAEALNRDKSGGLGDVREIVKAIQVRHYRTPCSAGFP